MKKLYRLRGRPIISALHIGKLTEQEQAHSFKDANNDSIDILNWTDIIEVRLSKILADPEKWIDENIDSLCKRFNLEPHQTFSNENLLVYFIEKEVLDKQSTRDPPNNFPLNHWQSNSGKESRAEAKV